MSCRCLIRHATGDTERQQAAEALRYARSVGDSLGVMLALAKLGACPKSTRDGGAS